MPSSPIDEFAAGLQPADILTLFAGLRNTVPVYAALGATGLNEGEDEELAKRRGPAKMPAPQPPSPEESDRRARMEFEARFPNPVLREMVIEQMLKQRSGPYSAGTATRRKDFEEAPESAQQFIGAAPKPKKYNKGGSAKKTLDEMQAELFKKSTKVADKPDLGRRSLFGLGSKSTLPLANIDTKALQKMQSELKGAPAITEKTVTVDPGKGAAKSTLKSIAETPLSRREVLQSAAGQVLRGALPDMTGLGALGNVAKAVESVPTPVPTMPQTLQGLIAHFAKKGLDEDDTIKMLEKLGYDEDDVLYMLHPMRNPEEFAADYLDEPMKPSRVLSNLINSGTDEPVMSMRGPLREIKRENPEMYKDLIRSARDISEYGFED
jgi:hypothetical protein